MKSVNYAVGGLIAVVGLACIGAAMWLPGGAPSGDPLAAGFIGLVGAGLLCMGR